MDWIQTLSIIATILATSYYIHRDIVSDMKTQSARTDRLYEMFCDLQRQIKDDTLQMKKEHYEFMRDNKK